MAVCWSVIGAPPTPPSARRSKLSTPAAADEVAELLALHFGHSDDAEKAVDYAIAAAEKSQRRWANNEALSYFDDALRRLDALPDTMPNRLRRIDAVLKQAEAKFAIGKHAEQIQALEGIRGIIDFIRRSAPPGRLALLDRVPAHTHRRPAGCSDRSLQRSSGAGGRGGLG